MVAISIIIGIFLFAYFAHKFEADENYKAAVRFINNEIKIGNAIKLIDGRIVFINEMTIDDKKLSNEYIYLQKRGISVSNLNSLQFRELKNLVLEEEKKARIEYLQEKREKEKQLFKEKKEKQWSFLKTYCSEFNLQQNSRTPGIYLILSTFTEDFYIGSSKNLYRRKMSHINDLLSESHHSYKMNNDCKEYGIDNFKFYTLEKIENYLGNDLRNHLEEREQYFIDQLKPTYNHYLNVKNGKYHNQFKNTYNN